MTERNTYGRGEVNDRIALSHRTSADLDASVRAYLTEDESTERQTMNTEDFCDEYVCPFGHTFTTDGSDRHCPICQWGDDEPDDDDGLEPDEIDSWERMMWITHPPRPEPYMDGGRLRYD